MPAFSFAKISGSKRSELYLMPTIEMILVLILVGAATGSLTALINVAPTFIAIPALYFFLPIVGFSFDEVMVPLVASCVAAFIPVHLYAWIQSMKQGQVDSQQLINFAPSMAMGGVIGAQLLSLSSAVLFKICFTLMAVMFVFKIVFNKKLEKTPTLTPAKAANLPIGLVVGSLSVMSGNSGTVLANGMNSLLKIDQSKRDGTTHGLVVFVSIAALVGFIFPAKPTIMMDGMAFAGAIHLPSVLFLTLSHFLFYWLCRQRGNDLDKRVLSLSVTLYVCCSLIRFWSA